MNYIQDSASKKLVDYLLDISNGDEDYAKFIFGVTANDKRLKELLIRFIETILSRNEKVDPQQVINIAIYFAKNGEKAWNEFEQVHRSTGK